ncbi:MAG: adenylate/guanylate cyclase domain-containing protein [Myxococcaceae bacterium]
MADPRARLGEKLIAAGHLSPGDLNTGLSFQRREGGFLGDVLVAHGLMNEEQLLGFLSQEYGAKYLGAAKLAQARIGNDVLELMPVREAERLCVLPLSYSREFRSLSVAVPDLEPSLLAQMKAAAKGLTLVPVLALRAAIKAGIQRFYYLDPYAFASLAGGATAQVGGGPAGDVIARTDPEASQAVPAAPAAPFRWVPPQPGGQADDSPGTVARMMKLHETVEAQQREIKLLRVAIELHHHLTRERNLPALVRRVLAFAFDNLPADDGALLLEDEATGLLTPCAVRSKDGDDSQVVVSETLLREVMASRKGVLTADAVYDPRFSGSQTVIAARMRSAMAVPIIVEGEVRGAICLASRGRTGVFTEGDLNVLSAIAGQTSVSMENVLLSRRLVDDAATRAHLARFLSPAVVELASSGAVSLEQAGELQEATVLFADIRSFTSMAERLEPREVVALLNEHFEEMVNIVFSHGGVLDKFIGDALMAVWGAPLRRDDDPARALRAALEMAARVETMNQRRAAEGREQFAMGIGVNTGMVVFGAMGASRRLELTAIGDPVNIASRLCGLAEPGQIVTTEATLRAAGSNFLTVPLPAAQLKGKAHAIRRFAVTGELNTE